MMITNAESVDAEYEKMARGMSSHYPNIEPFLLAKSAMLRKRYPDERQAQHFWIDLYYREGTDDAEKSSRLFRETEVPPAYHGHSHFALDIQCDLDMLLAVASDPDIKLISGDVFPQ